MPKPIHMNEIMAELQKMEKEASEGPKGFTTEDIADAEEMTLQTIRSRIKKWIKQGLVERVGRRAGHAMDGKKCWTPVYRVKKK